MKVFLLMAFVSNSIADKQFHRKYSSYSQAFLWVDDICV